MGSYSEVINFLFQAIGPCWAELVGSFLMAAMINLVSIKGSQKESFVFFSLAFYTLVVRSIVSILYTVMLKFNPDWVAYEAIPVYTDLLITAIASSLFIVGAFKNLRVYFSAGLVVVVLASVFAAISFIQSKAPLFVLVKTYLPPSYLTLSLFVAGASFFINKTTRQYRPIRSVGSGFIVLSICYGYRLFGLINIQQILFMCYTIAIVLALASQIQFLNVYTTQLSKKLEAEKRGKYEIWEFSPFPIVISRLRDDEVLYMNPVACQLLTLTSNEISKFPLSMYFADKQKKEELLSLLRQKKVVQTFEAQVHHPEKNNFFWISMTTQTTDIDEEIVLFTTFRDITEQKQATDLLKEQAATDSLTGLLNRRQFEILSYQALQTARRYGKPFSIAMLDIDFFKKVNDTYGHDAGDAVLKNLAKTLVTVLRKSDIIARFGGEEFVVFFAQTPPEGALIAAEHVREAVEKMNTIVDKASVPITISIGISDSRTTNLNTLIKQADEALYYSKEQGRNRTTLYSALRATDKEEKPENAPADKDAGQS